MTLTNILTAVFVVMFCILFLGMGVQAFVMAAKALAIVAGILLAGGLLVWFGRIIYNRRSGK